ncbi:MAG: peptidoglycan editing factor PgeF [Sulfurovum sp.]|nr:MAG: peptidoglycan editing factor PgeF [Sulfurovum sp.]
MKNIYTFTNLSKEKKCVHLVTQKDSIQPYSFSLALHTQEDPLQIIKNRNFINQKFPNMHFIVANQTHSANVEIITKQEEAQGWADVESAIKNCDALITNQKNIMLTILTADCVPILLFDKKQNVIAVVHAGWKGTEKRIVSKTVEKMREVFDSNPKDILASIAPAIGRCCYEVDWNVAKYFKNIENAYDNRDEKQMLDLPYINKVQLLQVGLDEHHIELSNICTACEVEKYFSYRKEKGCSGRFMSMIGLK